LTTQEGVWSRKSWKEKGGSETKNKKKEEKKKKIIPWGSLQLREEKKRVDQEASQEKKH